jgi:hypothetical protein
VEEASARPPSGIQIVLGDCPITALPDPSIGFRTGRWLLYLPPREALLHPIGQPSQMFKNKFRPVVSA